MSKIEQNLYNILNIPEKIILEPKNSLNHWLLLARASEENLQHINEAIKIINKFHSYFHFEQSLLYVISTYIHHVIGDKNSVSIYLEKAIFQDHLNQQALNFLDIMAFRDVKSDVAKLLHYGKNRQYESEFLSFAIGDFKKLESIEALDIAIKSVYEASAPIELDYKSHRLLLANSMISLFLGDLDKSQESILAAIEMTEKAHKNYHQLASTIYKERAESFKLAGHIELSKNDMVKAYDLFPVE